jgi:hypothetical protein
MGRSNEKRRNGRTADSIVSSRKLLVSPSLLVPKPPFSSVLANTSSSPDQPGNTHSPSSRQAPFWMMGLPDALRLSVRKGT